MFGEIPYHGVDPVLLTLWGPVAIRWYGLGYLVGFMVGVQILKRLARRGFLPMTPAQPMDLLLWLVVGVVAGGRLGFLIFYQPGLWSHPERILAVWEGGLSFHGGLAGVAVAGLLYCGKARLPFLRVGDGLALAVTPGIFCVRVANFINGELFGRKVGAWAPPWAMRFPRSPEGLARLRELGAVPSVTRHPREEELAILRALRDGTWAKAAPDVPLRHPSQLYEALGEGALLGIILWIVYLASRRRGRELPAGALGAVFLMGYGAIRFGLEWFREPDAEIGFDLGFLTRGQELCLAMVLAGAALLWWARRRRGA